MQNALNKTKTIPFAALALPVLAVGFAYAVDLPRMLGAHPFWSQDVLLYGALPGLVLALVLRWASITRLVPIAALAIAAVLAFGVASIGKARFAASFAEDALAGQLWFFGWIGAAIFFAAFISAVGTLLERGRG